VDHPSTRQLPTDNFRTAPSTGHAPTKYHPGNILHQTFFVTLSSSNKVDAIARNPRAHVDSITPTACFLDHFVIVATNMLDGVVEYR
jgi:hypothetical protein